MRPFWKPHTCHTYLTLPRCDPYCSSAFQEETSRWSDKLYRNVFCGQNNNIFAIIKTLLTQKCENKFTPKILSMSSGLCDNIGWCNKIAALFMRSDTWGTPLFSISLAVSATCNCFDTSTTYPYTCECKSDDCSMPKLNNRCKLDNWAIFAYCGFIITFFTESLKKLFYLLNSPHRRSSRLYEQWLMFDPCRSPSKLRCNPFQPVGWTVHAQCHDRHLLSFFFFNVNFNSW